MNVPPHPYAQIARQLSDTAFADITYLEETGSTNADAAALLGEECALGMTIVAEHQTHGVGRKGRNWASHPGSSLLFTTILPVTMPSTHIWAVPFWSALAISAALRAHHVDTTLHWPNDLLIGQCKLAGILCTSRVTGGQARVACGVGINVRRYAAADADIVPPPAFCNDVADVDRAELLESILRAYDATLADLTHPHTVTSAWERAAGVPGAVYRILKDGDAQAFTATAAALSQGGALVVKHGDGTTESISLAEARALR